METRQPGVRERVVDRGGKKQENERVCDGGRREGAID